MCTGATGRPSPVLLFGHTHPGAAGIHGGPRTPLAASDYGKLWCLPSFSTMKHVLKTSRTPGKDDLAISVTSPGPRPHGPTRKAHRQQACPPPHPTKSETYSWPWN